MRHLYLRKQFPTFYTVEMTLVEYSDSESSGSDEAKTNPRTLPSNNAAFSINKSNPRKIQVKLTDQPTNDDEPPAKRPRVGGVFSGFNAMLPAPKRDDKVPVQKSTRRVFSLKTSGEPAFSREFDDGPTERETVPDLPMKGNAMIFKPLSVARNVKKKVVSRSAVKEPAPISTQEQQPKVSLFGNVADDIPLPEVEDTEDLEEEEREISETSIPTDHGSAGQSLEDVASDLNLSASARRQLLGRNGKSSGTAINIVNFNTDMEYAANEELRAAGQQVQHNPVRAIAPGKHSLKQLVSAASGQKEALEESFASGKRNKKEAGSRYGW